MSARPVDDETLKDLQMLLESRSGAVKYTDELMAVQRLLADRDWSNAEIARLNERVRELEGELLAACDAAILITERPLLLKEVAGLRYQLLKAMAVARGERGMVTSKGERDDNVQHIPGCAYDHNRPNESVGSCMPDCPIGGRETRERLAPPPDARHPEEQEKR